MDAQADFNVVETTIADIHAAYLDGRLTARRLVETYFERIAAYDKAGPAINAVISTNPKALEEADALDAALTQGGLVGPLHGIPLIMKDQADVKDMPTTMGSVMFRDHYPDRDCFAVAKLKAAGAIFIGKSTLGELGAGDTHGSLFGSTRNVYDLERTAGGSSGGSGAAVSANFCAVAIGQEGFASIRRPSIWNGVAGMRPTAGLVSRGGVYAGWPTIIGSLGPMARTVEDLARVLECMVGFDPQDPVTALGHGKAGQGFYDYPEGGKKALWPGLATEYPKAATQPNVQTLVDRLVTVQAVETARCLDERVVTDPRDADLGALLGWGFPAFRGGPVSHIHRVGVGAFVALCDQLADEHGRRFTPPALLRYMAARQAVFYER
jgi:Asp-tRNA(Asn)/Glu-tRNA(Gln) amidotransferase A subunit family amidase